MIFMFGNVLLNKKGASFHIQTNLYGNFQLVQFASLIKYILFTLKKDEVARKQVLQFVYETNFLLLSLGERSGCEDHCNLPSQLA